MNITETPQFQKGTDFQDYICDTIEQLQLKFKGIHLNTRLNYGKEYQKNFGEGFFAPEIKYLKSMKYYVYICCYELKNGIWKETGVIQNKNKCPLYLIGNPLEGCFIFKNADLVNIYNRLLAKEKFNHFELIEFKRSEEPNKGFKIDRKFLEQVKVEYKRKEYIWYEDAEGNEVEEYTKGCKVKKMFIPNQDLKYCRLNDLYHSIVPHIPIYKSYSLSGERFVALANDDKMKEFENQLDPKIIDILKKDRTDFYK